MKVKDQNLETKDVPIEDESDDLNELNIEATLGRIVKDGKNRPFAHTCNNPSPTCECWIAINEDGIVRYQWISTRPNRRLRRYQAAKRKEPLRNDGTPKRFDRPAPRRKAKASGDSQDGETARGTIHGDSASDQAQQRTNAAGSQDR